MDLIDLIIYIAIAFSGTVFGSFFTLAVHRIPKHQDITHERSYCPKCNHKLQFLDLIPVFSYIFLGGKCRYCKEKIRPRYLILEICSGAVFLLLALSYSINYNAFIHIENCWPMIVHFVLNVLFLCAIFIIAGIDKEYKKIPNSLIIYGSIVCILKLAFQVFLCVTRHGDLRFVSDLLVGALIPMGVLLIELIYVKVSKKEDLPIGIGDLKYLAVLGLYFGLARLTVGVFLAMCIVLFVLLAKAFDTLIHKQKDVLKQIITEKEIPLGFYLAIPFTFIMIFFPLM